MELQREVGRAMRTITLLHRLVWPPVTQGLTIFFRPPQHTPAGCTRGDLQILRNLHLHEHFQRADIKAGCRDVLESHGV